MRCPEATVQSMKPNDKELERLTHLVRIQG